MSVLTSPLARSALQRFIRVAGFQAVAPRTVSMKVVPATTIASKESYEERNARLGRELSPHLSIYKPQLTSMLSITHRGTGLALASFAWALGLGALMSSHDISSYVTVIEGLQMSAATLTAMKFVIAFPLAYHTANGIRHLIWDTGRFLKINEVYTTGYAMVGGSVILAIILALL